MRNDCRRPLLTLSIALLPAVAHAQALVDALPGTPMLQTASPAERVGQETTDRIAQGRAQYESNDARAVTTLREAAQSALTAIGQVSGVNVLTSQARSLPSDEVTSRLAEKAAAAHYYWGLSADRFARRDEAITALTRSLRIMRAISAPTRDAGTLRRDALLELGRVLRDGLPLVAPDDALDSIAAIAHGGLWSPRRFGFEATSSNAEPGTKGASKFDFLVTDGKLFPPVAANNALARVPPYYQNVPEVSLPAVLHLDKMVAGYARETSGPNKGQWRQAVRVFYSSPYLTKDRRDDLPRALDLCQQFLKVQTLMKENLGATNLYSRGDRIEAVSTLWLLEVSALWPMDDTDPSIQAQLGPLMPKLNTGSQRDVVDPEVTSTVRPWTPIAGQSEANPGEIMFWKASMARPDAEWVRELFHEYGHVSLPPIGGFAPPLEPFANGLMGETLGMIWAAQTPDRFNGVNGDYANHVATQALPALRYFLKAGSNSPLRLSGTIDGARYLQGLTTYLERVYGGKMLGRALTPLSARAAKVENLAARRSLMNTQTLLNSIDTAWKNPWGSGKAIPVWLPGALDNNGTAASLISRGDAVIKSGTNVSTLLYVPEGTDSLRIDGVNAGKIRAVGLPFKAAEGAVRIYFAGRSGWQNFSLTSNGDARISGARFEKK